MSPLHAETHAGLAPAVIGIGHHDPLLAQDLAYAAAGVPTVLREYPDLVHGFFGMGAISASAEKAADELSPCGTWPPQAPEPGEGRLGGSAVPHRDTL